MYGKPILDGARAVPGPQRVDITSASESSNARSHGWAQQLGSQTIAEEFPPISVANPASRRATRGFWHACSHSDPLRAGDGPRSVRVISPSAQSRQPAFLLAISEGILAV